MWVQSLGQEDPLEKEMSTHSSILARKIPWTEEPGGPQSMGLQTVGCNTVCSFRYLNKKGLTSLQWLIKSFFRVMS